MAAGLAGQTIVLHCSCSIEAVGVNESILDSWSSRCALCAARTWEASSSVSTSSACEMTHSTRKDKWNDSDETDQQLVLV